MSSGKTWSFRMLSLDVLIVLLLVWAAQRIVALDVCTKSIESCSAATNGYSEFIGQYTFPTTPIQTLECKSEEAIEVMKKGFPVVLKNCHFSEITQGWTIEYLKENLMSPNLTVYKSPTRRFLFYNRDTADVAANRSSWTPPHNVTAMSFTQFLDVMDQLESAGNGTKAYLQTNLEKEFLNSDMQDDVFMFNTRWMRELIEKLAWGRQDVNLFLVGMGGVVTPAHYDIMENLFLQIHGKKRCILFSPENYKFLYPYPVYHPHDRQTQVNFDSPDFEMFPKFRNITGVDAVVGPGDVLYIPNYWWHYIESERDSKTISMNFWYVPNGHQDDEQIEDGLTLKQDGNQTLNDGEEEKEEKEESKEEKGESKIKAGVKMKRTNKESSKVEDSMKLNETEPVPYSAGELIGLSRDIENMIGEALGDVTKIGPFLKDMVDGRYDFV